MSIKNPFGKKQTTYALDRVTALDGAGVALARGLSRLQILLSAMSQLSRVIVAAYNSNCEGSSSDSNDESGKTAEHGWKEVKVGSQKLSVID